MKSSAPEASRLLALLASVAFVACAAEHTQTPAPFDPSASTGSPSPAPSATARGATASPAGGSDTAAAQTGAQKRPLEITSQCATPANYYVGEDPKAGGPGKRTVEPLQILPVERNRDGSQTVWLLDEHFAPLIKVGITRGMKKIEVGRSCRTLDAR